MRVIQTTSNYLFEDSGLLGCDTVTVGSCSDEMGKWRMCG